MPQLNLGSDISEEVLVDVGNTDRMLLWQASVTATSNIRYVQISTLITKLAAEVTTPVQTNLENVFIKKPTGTVTNNSFLVYSSSAPASVPWVASLTAPSASVITTSIANGAVTTAKLDQTAGSQAVTTATIYDGAVTSAKLGASVVIAGKLAADAVTTPVIANSAVTNDKVATGIDAGKISSISSSTIPAAAVPTIDVTKIATTTANPTGLPIAVGGTGAKTQSTALQNLLAYGGSDAATGRRIYIQTATPTGTFASGDLWFKI